MILAKDIFCKKMLLMLVMIMMVVVVDSLFRIGVDTLNGVLR